MASQLKKLTVWDDKSLTRFMAYCNTLHDLECDPEVAMNTSYASTTEHKGDFYTKCLGATAFAIARERVGLHPTKSESAGIGQ